MNNWIKQRTQWLLLICLIAVSPLTSASPEIQQWQTSNGARVYFVAAPELPMVDVRMIFDAAGARDGKLPGLALLTNGLLEEGAGKLNADQIADRFAAVGASFGTSSHRDMSVVNLRSLTQPELLDSAVATLATVLTQPTFPQKALDRERNRLLISLQAKKQSPDAITDDAFFHAVYGDHPYASDASGKEESVKKIKRQDLVNHYKRYYTGRNAIIAIVGAVDRKQAEALAESIIGKLPAGEPAPAIPTVSTLKAAQLVKKEFPSTQTHIQVGQPALTRNDPDYFPLYVGNHILGGGGFTSRLTSEIREKRGLSYSTYSYFAPMRQSGPFIMGLQTRNDQADEALKLLNETLNKFITEGPTEDELKASKQNITGGFALNLDSNSKIIDNIAAIGFYQLPLDYLDSYTTKVDAVTVEQIRDAFKRRLQPESMVTVMVGGPTNDTAQ
jgi:zinc protease